MSVPISKLVPAIFPVRKRSVHNLSTTPQIKEVIVSPAAGKAIYMTNLFILVFFSETPLLESNGHIRPDKEEKIKQLPVLNGGVRSDAAPKKHKTCQSTFSTPVKKSAVFDEDIKGWIICVHINNYIYIFYLHTL